MCAKSRTDKVKLPCLLARCKNKGVSHLPPSHPGGNHIGSGPALRQDIYAKAYNKFNYRLPSDHPLSEIGGDSSQAHHLICSEAMNDEDWPFVCAIFGYDINDAKNGVILPASMKIACSLAIPLHRGNHSATVTDLDKKYVFAVSGEISNILDKAFNGDYCNDSQKLTDELNGKSQEIWLKLRSFAWTLTYDGQDYHPAISKGCLGASRLSKKMGINGVPGKRLIEAALDEFHKDGCPDLRNHNVVRPLGPHFLER
jgi:hypothetical protein